MDIDEPSTSKPADMRSRGPHKHWCKVCTRNFRSGKALGGHMTCHRLAVVQPRSTPSPPVIVDLPVSLLDSSDVKPLQTSLETKCLHCSKEFSTCQSLRGNMQMHSAKKVMTKPDEEPAELMGASANVNGYHGHNVMLFSPVKRKRSKRGMPVLDSEEMCAAATLLMLAEYSDKISASENCCRGDNNDNISTPNLLKEVNLNAFDQLSQPDEFLNNTRPKSVKNASYEGFYDFSEKENNLNLAADVPKKMLLLNVFDDGLVDGDAEFMKPGADISVDEVKFGSLSAAVNVKRYQCKVCRKLLSSGYTLGCHMRLHCEKENSLNLVPKKPAQLNVFDHGLDVDAEFMKPGVNNSIEDLKSGDLSAAVNIKSYQCKVCGKLLRSGRALGGHMTIHLHCEQNTLKLVADVPKIEVLPNVFDHGLDAGAEFMKPGADISVEKLQSDDLSAAVNIKRHECKVCGKLLRSGRALGGHMTLYSHCGRNTLNLVADVPKMEVIPNVFDHGLDAGAEFMKPGADISVEQLQSGVLSAAVNIKRHQCQVCGKLLRSGHALGGHMRSHYGRKCNLDQGVADCPNSEEQMQKLGLDSPIFYRRRPRSHGSEI
ncbi:uncharacterized protein LOC120699903 isoform X2 [Panicum virgatum]|nr:uncharacterized protein LOC120699903 isoform X2 [Panicum virgatum]